MNRYRSLTILMLPVLIAYLAFSTGCQTFHTGLSDAEFTNRVQERFSAGMSEDDVRTKLRAMQFNKIRTRKKDYPEHGIHAGDLSVTVWPKRFIIEGIVDYYFKDIMFFRFGGDNALDDVVFRLFGWNENAGDPLVIELNASENKS